MNGVRHDRSAARFRAGLPSPPRAALNGNGPRRNGREQRRAGGVRNGQAGEAAARSAARVAVPRRRGGGSAGGAGGGGAGGSGGARGSIGAQYSARRAESPADPRVLFASDFENGLAGWTRYTNNTDQITVLTDAALAHAGTSSCARR